MERYYENGQKKRGVNIMDGEEIPIKEWNEDGFLEQ